MNSRRQSRSPCRLRMVCYRSATCCCSTCLAITAFVALRGQILDVFILGTQTKLQGFFLSLHPADIILPGLQLLPQIINLLYVDIPLPADIFLGHLQLTDQFEQSYFSILTLDDLILAVVDIDLQFLHLIVESGGTGLQFLLQSEDVLLQGTVLGLQLDYVFLKRKDQLALVVHSHKQDIRITQHILTEGHFVHKRERQGQCLWERVINLLGNIMGSCWPGERSDRSNISLPLPRNPQEKIQAIVVDSTNTLIRSYRVQQDGNTFEKLVYDWKSIPIISQFQCRERAYFTVRNRGIREDNFVVGVIKRSALATQMPMPWRTRYCICYESHKNSGESGILFQGKLMKAGESVGVNDIIKVVMSQDEIQFKSGKKTLAYMKLPVDFLSDEVMPYVALFNVGDKIQFLQPVTIQ